MPTFTKIDQTTLAPFHATHAAAKAAVATAGDVTADADAQHVALLAKIDALGSEPQPNDFETSAAWQTAQAEHRFAIAKLQPGIAPLAAKVDAARAAYGALLSAINNAEVAIRHAETKLLTARVELITEQMLIAVVERERSNDGLPIGHKVTRPASLAYHPVGYGMVTVGLARNVDPATIAVD